MKLLEILEEGLSDIVYHSTMLRSAINILETGQFELQASFAKETESSINNSGFYLSTTRSRTGEYHTGGKKDQYISDFTVLFELDGKKLSQQYKAKPVDYWGPLFKDSNTGSPLKDEMEDRVFSRTRTIPSLPYIKKIDIYVKTEDNHSFFGKSVNTDKNKYLLYFYNLAKQNGIEVRFFNTMSSFIIGKKPIPAGEALKIKHKPEGVVTGRTPIKRYKSSYGSDLNRFIKMAFLTLRGKPLPDVNDKSVPTLYNLQSPYWVSEALRIIKNDLHNDAKSPKMTDVAQLMKLYKASSFDDLYDKVIAKTLQVNSNN
jgi:hypothetical protein